MLRNRFRQVCLYTLFLVGMFAVVPFSGQAVRITTGPSAEPRVETRARDENRRSKRRQDELKQARKTALQTPTVSMATAGVSYRPYYGHYPYYRDGHRCSGGRCIRGKATPRFYRSNPGQYQNYYMYHNYYEGWS